MEALKFINKFLDNLIQWVSEDCGISQSSIYKFCKDNDLLVNKNTLNTDKLSQFILNPDNFEKSFEFFYILEQYSYHLHYDDCDNAWVGEHLTDSDLSVKEQEITEKINIKQIKTFKQLFEAFEH